MFATIQIAGNAPFIFSIPLQNKERNVIDMAQLKESRRTASLTPDRLSARIGVRFANQPKV